MPRERVRVTRWEITVERPRSADALIDEAAFARDEFLPYWAELWPSAIALARHVSGLDLRDRRVLEVGCGLGLPSVAAALAGAEVVATDWSEDALSYATRNAARNGVRIATALVRWDDPDSLEAHGSFELVLAADVLYEPRNAAPLLGLLGRTVATGGSALVADPGRRHAGAFLEEARRDGWILHTLSEPSLPRGGIHRLWRD